MRMVNWLLENHRGEKFLLKVGQTWEKMFTEKNVLRLMMIVITVMTVHITTNFYHPILSGLVMLLFAVALIVFVFWGDDNKGEEPKG